MKVLAKLKGLPWTWIAGGVAALGGLYFATRGGSGGSETATASGAGGVNSPLLYVPGGYQTSVEADEVGEIAGASVASDSSAVQLAAIDAQQAVGLAGNDTTLQIGLAQIQSSQELGMASLDQAQGIANTYRMADVLESLFGKGQSGAIDYDVTFNDGGFSIEGSKVGFKSTQDIGKAASGLLGNLLSGTKSAKGLKNYVDLFKADKPKVVTKTVEKIVKVPTKTTDASTKAPVKHIQVKIPATAVSPGGASSIGSLFTSRGAFAA